MTIDQSTLAGLISRSNSLQTPANDLSKAEFLDHARNFYAQQAALGTLLSTHGDASAQKLAQSVARQAAALVDEIEELQRRLGFSATSGPSPNT